MGPFQRDMGELATSYNAEQRATIADFLARTRDILLANAKRVEKELPQECMASRSDT